MKTAVTLSILLIIADPADAQRYEHYGSDLFRLPGYGTYEKPLYRGESTAPPKKRPAEAWLFRRQYERPPTARSRSRWNSQK